MAQNGVLMRATFLFAIFLLVTACQPRWQTLVPGQEERFAKLVEPAAGELREDWEWHNAWVDETGVTVTYGPLGEPPVSCREAPVCVRLAHPSRGVTGDVSAGEFVVQKQARGEGEAILDDGSLVDGLADRLEAEDGFWQSRLVWGMVLVEGGLALLLLLAFAAMTFRQVKWRIAAAVAGITAFSFGLRWLLVPVGPFHENHHALLNVHNVVTGGPPFHHVTSAHYVLMQWFVGVVAGEEGTFYFLAALLGALAVPLWGMVARRLADDNLVGWIAAAGVAILPLAVRMSPTATPFVLAVMLLPAAALALACALDNLQQPLGWIALVLAALLLALLAQSRILTVLMAPVSLLLAVAIAKRFARWQIVALLGSTLLATLLVAPHVLEILEVARGRAQDARYIGIGSLSESWLALRMLPFRPDYVSPTLLPLALVGCAWLWRRDLRRGLIAVTGLLWLLLVSGLVSTCTSLHLALELPLLVTLSAFSAMGIVAVARLLPGKVTAWGATAILIITSLLPWSVFSLAPPETQEYRFITQEVFGYLDVNDDTLLYVAPEREGGREVIPLAWWQRQLPGVLVRSWVDGEEVPAGAFVYLGLSEIPVAEESCGVDSTSARPRGGMEVAVRRVELPEARFLCGKLTESSLTLYRQNGKHRALIGRE